MQFELSEDLALTELVDHAPGRLALAIGTLGKYDASVKVLYNAEMSCEFASVSKLVASLAFLVATEEGVLDLGADLPEGPFTLAHLLSHSSGLQQDGDRHRIEENLIREPGTKRIYSNIGFELAGSLLEFESEMNFTQYVREAVLAPLGMGGTAFRSQLFIHGGVGAATGLVGTVMDLVSLIEGLYYPRLVSSPTLQEFSNSFLPGLAGVLPGFGSMTDNSWGLGCEIRGSKNPHWSGRDNSPATYGHFGRSGSLLWIDPVRKVFLASLSEVPFAGWAVHLWPKLSQHGVLTLGE